MIGQNEYSPRANMWRGYRIAFFISCVLHMPFFPLQFMTAFGGANVLFIIFTFYDFFYWVGSFFLFHAFAGLKSPQFIVCLICGIFGFIVDMHNGIYIISKVYCTGDFFSAPTCDMSQVLLVLGFILALCTTL